MPDNNHEHERSRDHGRERDNVADVAKQESVRNLFQSFAVDAVRANEAALQALERAGQALDKLASRAGRDADAVRNLLESQKSLLQERAISSRELMDSLRGNILSDEERTLNSENRSNARSSQEDAAALDMTKQAERLAIERVREAMDSYNSSVRLQDDAMKASRQQLAETLSTRGPETAIMAGKRNDAAIAQESDSQIRQQTQEQNAKLQEQKTMLDRSTSNLELAVRESNLFYDIDHYRPQSTHEELANKANNLGFLMADENRRKGADEFTQKQLQAMDLRQAISLQDAMKAEQSARQAVTEMLGSRRFSEIKELNDLWQKASQEERVGYSQAQREMRRLIAEDQSEAAIAVRKALSLAQVEIVSNGESYRFRLNDEAYRKNLNGESYSFKDIQEAIGQRRLG